MQLFLIIGGLAAAAYIFMVIPITKGYAIQRELKRQQDADLAKGNEESPHSQE